MTKRLVLLATLALLLSSCTAVKTISSASLTDVIATNAFYYYDDVDEAWSYYRDVLGFATVADYGFAKIMRLANSSYLTLVRASEGMHSAAEPKTVTLSLVTDELTSWQAHLVNAGGGNTMRQGSNHFVVMDPGGYALKFVRFNPHPAMESYVPGFAAAVPVAASPEDAAGNLSVRATVTTVYFAALTEIIPFYESLFGISSAGQMDGHALYQFSDSGFLLLNEGGDELHVPTEKNGVTLSFLTTDIEAWFERAVAQPGFRLRTEEILNEGGLVRVFVGYDPAGTFLEWDTFLPVEGNERLMHYLR